MLVTRNTLQLRPGDLVHTHGMRVRLGEPTVLPITAGLPVCIAWYGLVENADDLCNPEHPDFDPFIASFLRGANAYSDPALRDHHNVQGNVYARWTVDLDSNISRAETAGVLPAGTAVAS